ncbi:MAG: hypothetical protein WD342_05520 [Verrucomicrobiales bacterium]
MKIHCPLPRFALLLAFSLLLSGCGGNWLVGKWTLDKERTVQEIGRTEKPDGDGLLKDLVDGLQKGISRVMLSQFDGVVLEFTPNELRRLRNGVGEAQTYEIIERPARDRYVVQYEDGEIATWSRVEGGIRMKLPGETERWVWFEPFH